MAWLLGATAMSAHAISDYVIRTARAALSTAARTAQRRGSGTYSTLLASLLYDELKKELRRTQADEVDKQNVLTKAIDRCRQAAEAGPSDAVEVLRAVLELLETGVLPQINATPQDRRAQLRVIQGNPSSPSKAVVSPSKAQLREIGVIRRAILTPRIASSANVTLMARPVLTIRRGLIG